MAEYLVLGGSGMLGRAFRELLTAKRREFDAPPRGELDLEDEDRIKAALSNNVRYVINCAAWTDVDAAEVQEEQATAINGTAVGRLASACTAANVILVHYSTDYVFPGTASTPYPVGAFREPLGAYGRSKLLGEQLLEEYGDRYYLLRTSWLYAPWGKNFVRTITKAARERAKLKVVSDQVGRPSSAQCVASTTLTLLERGPVGIYHTTDGGLCSWFQFAKAAVSYLDLPCAVMPCTSGEYPRPAPRPPYSVLDISETEQRVGTLPDWQDNLRRVLATLEPDRAELEK